MNMKIAYFSPLPPAQSGIADYSAILLPALASLVETEIFVEDSIFHQVSQDFAIPVRTVSSFRGPLSERVHMSIYQLGANTQFHTAIYETMRRYPGITVLHDLNLSSFFGELYLRTGQLAEYTRLMALAYGNEGLEHVRSAHRGEVPYDIFRYPLFAPVVQRSLGTIVHSQFAESLVRRQCPSAQTTNIPLLTNTDLPWLETNEAKLQLGYTPSDTVIAAFGYVAPQKRIDRLLTAVARLRVDFPELRLAIVGKVVDGYDLVDRVNNLQLADITRMTGYVAESELQTYLAATDIGCNLRYPTIGESSATLMALMAAGKPTLISNIDAFSELPDAACVKIDVGVDEASLAEEDRQIEAALRALLQDVAKRREIGLQARHYVEEHCSPKAVAGEYLRFIEQLRFNVKVPAM